MRPRQWLLLCVLAFALVGMHHVPASPCDPHVEATSHAAEQADPQRCHTPDGGHDLVHLCLMVLGGVAGILLVWLLVAVAGAAGGPARRVSANRRPPRLAGRALLTSVCVLRT